MEEDNRSPLTPPEWGQWNVAAKLTYVAVLVAVMAGFHAFFRWLVDLIWPVIVR